MGVFYRVGKEVEDSPGPSPPATTKMLRDTDALFQRPTSPARAPRMFPSSQPAAGTPTLPSTVPTEPNQTNNTRVETEEPENGQKQSNNNRRRKQERPQRSGGYNFEVCTQCTCTRRPTRVHRATQTYYMIHYMTHYTTHYMTHY